MEGAELEFTQDALEVIASRAMSRDTGARALRAVLDSYMLELMYELPDLDNTGTTYIIDGEAIESGRPLAKISRRKAKESA
jgi:ATP-dependent Clp protease ATP-binding subunit ClpX